MQASATKLVAKMAADLNITEDEAKERINVMVEALLSGLCEGRSAEFRNFGNITPTMMFDSIAVNPRTSEKQVKSKALRLTFTCSDAQTVTHPIK